MTAFPQAKLDALIDEARATNTSALVVMQNGEVVLDEILDGRGERPIETMSVTKAVLSLVVGRAVTLGHLPGADVPVSDFFPEWRQGRKRDVTLRHLMTHTSGLQNVPMAPAEIYPSPDFVQLALCAELEHAPGTVFAYNNKAVNLICGLLERATGQKADDFARAELFGPLGIEEWEWVREGAGNPHGMSGLGLRARDLARLGQLALDGGEVGSQPLISREWVQESTRAASPVFGRIGLLWWMWPEWTRIVVTSDHVQAVAGAGSSTRSAAALEACVGEWSSWGKLWPRLVAEGFDREQMPRGVRWANEQFGPVVGFGHDGWLGQYLHVLPGHGLVAVRLIDEQHPHAHQEVSAFPTFPDRLLALASA